MEYIFLWLISFFVLIALIVLVVYQLVCLTDMEQDYINPYDSSALINRVILPEFITQGLLSCFYVLTGHWPMTLLAAPYLFYNLTLYSRRQHLIDVTEIFNCLSLEKNRRFFKLVYLVILLLISLAWMVWSVLEEDMDF